MWRKCCGWLLKALGWTVVEPPVEEEKCIILGVPHTSIWDFAISYLYYTSVGGHARCMVKKSMFFPPLGWLLRSLGAIPVDRSNATALLKSVIDEMEKPGTFHLALAPEGTRKPVKNWKTKRVGRGQRVELTDDARADMKRIQQMYEDMHLVGKHPEKYITH